MTAKAKLTATMC